MISRVRTLCAFVFAAVIPLAAASLPASAADLPQVRMTKTNTVPACATPGRLMAFLTSRNHNIDERFSTIAADYMRIGDELKIRWDIAFFQMMLETGNLTFKGDVQASQNNFAGLGATGRHVPGESFPDVATGVKAHLQHLLLYAGVHLDNPVAERTRKVQEWGVLTDWQKSIKGPINYEQLAKQWAPSSRRYARDISGIAEAFYGSPCRAPDPNPELLALARPGSAPAKSNAADPKVAMADTAASDSTDASTTKLSGAELARRAVEEARKSGSFVRSSLGAEDIVPPADQAQTVAVGEPEQQEKPQAVKIINAAVPPADSSANAGTRGSADAASVEPTKKSTVKKIQTAALGAGTKSSFLPGITSKSTPTLSPAPRPTCKVWTASYGGSRSVIIRAHADRQDNYTVLDVNEGSEKREAAAYIAAYAKGGETVGEFTNPSQALDKAFELCPDG
ncbi:MAG TPA: glucosaminidase domain-containing protein [Hyphomicrobium sp.]|jgi:nucleotide-binding universal stress UspA family protein|nr:glucosaminidase domain-containing protein [Hyphomicrobium sp.]